MRHMGLRWWVIGWLCIGSIACIAPVHAQTQSAALPFPTPDEAIQSGRGLEDYIKQADAWLAAHRNSPHAPRVLMDLLMVATAAKQGEMADEMRARLLLSYGDSLPGRYAGMSFPDGKAFGEFVQGRLDKHWPELPPGLVRAFALVLSRGLKQYGKEVWVSDAFALKAALVARDAGEGALAGAALGQVRSNATSATEATRILDICFGQLEEHPKQIQDIHSLPDRTALSRDVEHYLLHQLGEQQADAPAMKLIHAELALEKRDFTEAIGLLESLPADQVDSRQLFLRLWAQAALGQMEKAKELVGQLRQRDAESPWTKMGGEAIELASVAQANLDQQAAALLEVLDKMRKEGLDTISLSVDLTPQNGPTIQAYVGIAPKSFEVQVRRDQKLLLAYRSTDKDSAMYSAADETVYQFAEPGLLPAPMMEIAPDGAGGASRFKLNMRLTRSGEALREAFRQLLESDALRTREGVRSLLAAIPKRGGLMMSADGEGEKLYAWITPQVDQPKFDRTEYVISADHKLRSVASSTGKLTVLGYGSADEVSLAPPPWPQARIVQQEKMDTQALLKLVQNFVGVATDAAQQVK